MNANENKNLIVAMVLMLAVWFGFSILFPPAPKDVPQPEQTQTEVAAPAEEVKQVAAAPVAADKELAPLVESDTPVATTQAPDREIIVKTDKYQAVFTSLGARLVSFQLNDYKSTADDNAESVQMYIQGQDRYATLRTTGSEGFVLSESANFETDANDIIEVTAGEQAEIRFRHIAANGIEYVKSYKLQGNTYTLDTSLELFNKSQIPLRGTIDFSLVQLWDESMEADQYTFSGPATLVKDEIDEVDVDDLEEGSVAYGSNVAWTSTQTKYFISAVVPGKETAERTRILSNGDAVENVLETPYFTLQGGERRVLDYLVFIGPKEPEQLKAAGHQLDRVVNFGFFNILSQPLFVVLTFFYGYFKNYGIAIILLTVLIKIIFWPLTHKSYSSMKAMQKLQPEMQKLRDRFKNDKERLNKEMMSLYKTHRVNPLGGCLPMLVQIPVFFALYKVLLDSIALRHAPFAFWLTDLSAKDPYYITPILMGASMFVQQKMTPTTADPMQAKIFMMMPIVFTFLFLNFPSGLVIYWLVNNLLTILQQYFIHRKST
jgi:YidC/Oxa1 family membrane protein insertase